jgi:hypothetical protein
LKREILEYTPAGKPSTNAKPHQLKMPMDVFKKKFDEALLKFGFKDTDLTAHK